MKKYTLDDLKQYNGANGKAYIAYRGKVYDLSESYLWEDGLHQDQHEAGNDLTEALDLEAPHESSMLDNFPVVGELDEENGF